MHGWMDEWAEVLENLTKCEVMKHVLHEPPMSEYGIQNQSHFVTINTQIMRKTVECELHSEDI